MSLLKIPNQFSQHTHTVANKKEPNLLQLKGKAELWIEREFNCQKRNQGKCMNKSQNYHTPNILDARCLLKKVNCTPYLVQAELTQVQLLVTLQSIIFLQVFLSIRNTENSRIRIKRPSSMSSRVDVMQHVSHPSGKWNSVQLMYWNMCSQSLWLFK